MDKMARKASGRLRGEVSRAARSVHTELVSNGLKIDPRALFCFSSYAPIDEKND